MSLHVVIFSKDRACQLDLLIRSKRRFLRVAHKTTIIYNTSGAAFNSGYAMLQQLPMNRDIIWRRQQRPQDFKDHLLEGIKRSPAELTMFLVDDDIFYRSFYPSHLRHLNWQTNAAVETLSLRLSRDTCYSYLADQNFDCPITEDCLFDWAGQPHDFGYPISLDGNIYRTLEITARINRTRCKNPNELEAGLNGTGYIRPKLAVFGASFVYGIPANRVQNTFSNRHEAGDHVKLNDQFLAGKSINLAAMIDPQPKSCHVPMPIVFA